METIYKQRIEALAAFLKVNPAEIRVSEGVLYTFRAFYHGPKKAYLVLTEKESETAARIAVEERLWVIGLESIFSYYDIDSYPSDVLEKLKPADIREANKSIIKLIENTCGVHTLTDIMLSFGNRPNILADYDQTEHHEGGYNIYRLY
ncbi:MAG: hypothetical protein KAW93_02465 [Methanogenium sp.]|nr:hypothetical protein [Methanogenium sp.]